VDLSDYQDYLNQVYQYTAGNLAMDRNMNVSFAGHSLGGGLASASAYASGGYAFTINAAGLHRRYRDTGNVPTIRAFYSHNDMLSLLQDLTPIVFPRAAWVCHWAAGMVEINSVTG